MSTHIDCSWCLIFLISDRLRIADSNDLLVLSFIETVILVQITIWNREFKQLSRELLCIVVLLRHFEHNVIAFLVDLRHALILRIGKLVNFNPLVVFSLDVCYYVVLKNKRHTQKERAADLFNALWLASREDDKVVVEHEGTFNVEVLDVGVSLNKPFPFLLRLLGTNIAFVGCHHELKAVVLKVDLYVDRHGLISVAEVYVLGHSMLFRQISSRYPTFLLHIEVVANVGLISSKEENVG